ncbi:helix-turn-helix domain-containing protein [Amycolatopsis sp. NBC_01488]|uniref:helix-turn-helix domain-containing protein n=1 Tax=Amycolatopsis sp. NBC_01488 TaxID=2903563 RepID=UPI002E2D3932|nr:helix-turn-helix domain-containing protein [Amycolatopsis sp. NBC_01488]
MFRVKAVAELLDVSRSTVYRAIEAGELDVLKVGAGRGAIRIPGTAVNVYLNTCAERGYADFVEGDQSPEAADDETAEVA